jgi:hypothetical protein
VPQSILPDISECFVVQLFHITSGATELHPLVDTTSHSPWNTISARWVQAFVSWAYCFTSQALLQSLHSTGSKGTTNIYPAISLLPCFEVGDWKADMLQSGLIQPSTSAFLSPILQVPKKDGSWHFYMDYRLLNALTIKRKFPIHMIDELSLARWFSSLDLHAGFSQIRLA